MSKKVYLDHAASTPMHENAIEMLAHASRIAYANPASQHTMGEALAKKIEQARAHFLNFLGADERYQLVFTSSATESNNWAILELASRFENIWGSPADHPSMTERLKHLDSQWYPLKDVYKCAADANKSFFSCTHVNSFSGDIVDIEKIRQALPDGSHLHVDASQSFGKLPFSISDWQADSVTITAHKMGGPRGIAALVIKKSADIAPALLGGPHEHGLRASTPPTALILSWAAALQNVDFQNLSAAQDTQERLVHVLKSAHPEIKPLTEERESSPYITTVILPKTPSDLVVRHLSEKGIAASSSSACSSRSKGFSPAFEALGIAEENHKYVLRLSTSTSTTNEEIDYFGESLKEVLESLS